MKRLALSLVALILASTASATPPEPTPDAARETAEVIVRKKLLQPLAAREEKQSRFSRARLPAASRRVRLEQAAVDGAGATFFTFAIDERHGVLMDDDAAWSADAIVGCVYPDSVMVFVKRGEEHRPAELLLGKKTKPAPAGTCTAAPPATTTASTVEPPSSATQG